MNSTSLPRPGLPLKWIAFLCTIVFAVIAVLVFVNHINEPDRSVFMFTASITSPGTTMLMKVITAFGTVFFLLPANLIWIGYFLYKKNREWALGVTLVSLSNVGLMSLLKNLFQRERPPLPLLQGITNYSFPSGHAWMSVACFGLFIWWFKDTSIKKTYKRILVALLILLIMLIGFSRISLRVHYATDVLAGFSGGMAWLVIAVLLIRKFLR